MKTKYTLIISLVALFASCKQTHKEAEIITFPINKTVQIENDSLLQNVKQIPLQISDIALIGMSPEIICTDTFIFVFNSRQAGNVSKFDYTGRFICNIGKMGSGPNEYISPVNSLVDQTNKTVEILAQGGIYTYDFNGKLIRKIDDSTPAFSFAKDRYNNYWFCTGNNISYSQYKVCKLENNRHSNFIPSTDKLLPVQENNFSNYTPSDITFHESFSYNLYKLNNKGELNMTLKIDFGKYNFPKIEKDVDMMTYYNELQKKDYITIMKYFDNTDYQYIYATINSKSRDLRQAFHWIIDKQTKKQYVLHIKSNKLDWFLFTPQMLTDNNELVLSGYTQSEIKNEKEYMQKNVSIFFVPIKSIIDYCK